MYQVVFSVHALERLHQRSKLSQEELIDMFLHGACSMVSHKNNRKYFVVWDNRQAKSLLVIVSEGHRNVFPTVITLFDTWERDNVRGVKVEAGYVEEAQRLRRRYMEDTRMKRENDARSLIRVDLIVGNQEDGFLMKHTRKSELIRISPKEYESKFSSDWRLLLKSYLIEEGLGDQIQVSASDRVYIELWQKERGGRRHILLHEEVL